MSEHPFLRYWWRGEIAGSPEALIAWGRAAGLLPLLSWRAQTRGWPLPDGFLDAARAERYAEIARQQLAMEQLRALATLAREQHFTPLVVKGPVIAETYPDPAFRTYHDIDLLLPLEQTEPLMAALTAREYRFTVGGDRGNHLPPLHPVRPGYVLEIHTALGHDRGTEQFTFAECAPTALPWPRFPDLLTLDPVLHALYLSHHLINHHQISLGLMPLADLYFWTRSWTGVAWRTLAEQAAARDLTRSVRLALALTAWFWDEPWPAWVQERFLPPEPRLLELGKQLTLGELGGRTPRIWRDLPEKSLRGWFAYVRIVARGNPAMLQRLSRRQRLLFYVRRPFSLLKYHGGTFWRLLRRDRRTREQLAAQETLADWLNPAGKSS